MAMADNEASYEYSPFLFLRCHSKTDKDSADVRTQIWQVVFNPRSKSNTVATCGGNKICLIDVKTGTVKQRYSAETREIFYALAWGIIDNQDDSNSLLAAGGARNVIYLIHPEHKFHTSHYKLQSRSSSQITSLMFYQHDTLFSCSSSGEVHVFNFISDFTNNEITLNLVLKLNIECEIFEIKYCKYSNWIFLATDSGVRGWFLNDVRITTMQCDDVIRFRLPKNSKDRQSNNFDLVDSVEVIKNGFIAVKCALHGTIYIFNACNIDKEDNELTTKLVVPNYILNWSSTDNYFMGISVNYDCGLLACGDDKGCIWLYDINQLKKKDANPKITQTIDPVGTLEWPIINDRFAAKSRKLNLDTYDIVIAKTAIHKNGKHIVAITNNNAVCIWKLDNV